MKTEQGKKIISGRGRSRVEVRKTKILSGGEGSV
jgi:hypothetical protein